MSKLGIALPLAIWASVYAYRFIKARRLSKEGAGIIHALAFAMAMAVFAVALLPPVDRLAERLFTMHMAQHLLLADLGPLLLLLGLTRLILRPLTRRLKALERALGPLAQPLTGLLLWLAILYLWHIPALYDAALASPALHALEHLSFVVAGVAFWWPLIQPIPMRRRLTGTQPLAYIATAKFGLGLLGVYLAFIPQAVYSHYVDLQPIWGLSPLEDQSIGGTLMMIEQSLVLATAFAIFFVKMLAGSERRQLRREGAALANYGADRK